jgi:hypothetical protein
MAAQHHDMDVPHGPPYVVGWKEYVGFVDWPLRRVRAKIDTGARTSALDVLSYELHEGAGAGEGEDQGGLTATLRLALDSKRRDRIQEVVTPVLKMVVVSNSNGMREQRPLVETTLRLGPVTKKVRLTITNRAGMRFRMILGRKALEGDFVVDVARKYLMRRVK